LLLLQNEGQAQEDVRQGQKAVVRGDGPHQIDQVAPRRSVDEPRVPEALPDNDG
jgi:hypothetical protein